MKLILLFTILFFQISCLGNRGPKCDIARLMKKYNFHEYSVKADWLRRSSIDDWDYNRYEEELQKLQREYNIDPGFKSKVISLKEKYNEQELGNAFRQLEYDLGHNPTSNDMNRLYKVCGIWW